MKNKNIIYLILIIISVALLSSITTYTLFNKNNKSNVSSNNDTTQIKPEETDKSDDIIKESTIKLTDEEKIKINKDIFNMIFPLKIITNDDPKFLIENSNKNLLTNPMKFKTALLLLVNEAEVIDDTGLSGHCLNLDTLSKEYSKLFGENINIDILNEYPDIKVNNKKLCGELYPTGWGIDSFTYKAIVQKQDIKNKMYTLYLDVLNIQGIEDMDLYSNLRNEKTLNYEAKYKLGILKIKYTFNNEIKEIVFNKGNSLDF